MTSCEICGKNTTEIYRAEIEGTDMNVCHQCAGYGKIKYVPTTLSSKESAGGKNVKRAEKEEPELRIVDNYAKIVRGLREKSGLTQEEFAKKINEKESLMKSIEGGKIVPSMQIAEKLEKLFGVILIEELENMSAGETKTNSKDFTIGDMITIKTRKK